MRTNRLEAIRQQLYASGSASIGDLAVALGASLATLRRDLAALEAEGAIERVHGGARLAAGGTTEIAFGLRENTNLSAKRQIADAAFELLKPQTTVFFDAATTVLQLAKRLRLSPMPLTAVTNGLAVAQELMSIPGIKVLMLGGELRPDNLSIVGPHAESQLDRMQFDQLFMGAGAIGEDGTIFNADLAEASLNARMLARSRQRILLVDSGKFDRGATYVVAPCSAATHVISDGALQESWRQRLGNSGLALIVAGA